MHAPSNHPWFDSEVKLFDLKRNEDGIHVGQALRKIAFKNRSADKQKRYTKNSTLHPHLLKDMKGEQILTPTLTFSLFFDSWLAYPPHKNFSLPLPPFLLLSFLSLLLQLHPIIYYTYNFNLSFYDWLRKVFKSLIV